MKKCHQVDGGRVGVHSRTGEDRAESTEKQTAGHVGETGGFRNPEA